MAQGAIADLEFALKESYPQGTFKDPVDRSAKFRKSLAKADIKLNGEGVGTFPINFAPANSIGAITDFEAFPRTKNRSSVQGKVRVVKFAGAVAIGGTAKYVAGSGKGTFENGGELARSISDAVDSVAKYMERVYAFSNRGRLAIVATDTANGVTCSDPLGIRALEYNYPISIYTALSGGSIRDSIEDRDITLTDDDTRAFSYSGNNQTAVAGDSVFAAGTYARTPYTLDDIVDNGTNADTLFEVTTLRTTYPLSKGQVSGNGGTLRNIGEQEILTLIEKCERGSGKRITRALSGPGVARNLLKHGVADRQFAGVTGNGTPQYTFGMNDETLNVVTPSSNLKWESARDIQPRKAYFLAPDTWGLCSAKELGWEDEDGGMLKRMPGTDNYKDGFLAFVSALENIFNVMPRANGRMDDVADADLNDVV